ncbi:uncharacterized protein M6B38_308920 [Iris pallida]|uniref:Uncharacterized protein n=1 Tax=Iris pallida TaxID=29817 RepID=A0AAX6HL44_IRIPA|nr:uncharacterized protein M6B38_308920 [Iris pallida]
MPDPLPACFGGIAGGPPASTATGPSLTTSVYETLLGVASLTWSRTVLGLLVRVVLRIDEDDEEESEALTFKIRPWLLWKRRGSRRLRVKDRHVDVSWDLSRAKFPATGGPEPSSGYSLSISVDGEPVLLAGDLKSRAAAKSRLISRREHVGMGEERTYSTRARFGGRERSVAIELDGELLVEVDGKPVVQVRRLRWKFRGSERVNLGGGDRVLVSWDLHDWLFPSKKDTAAAPSSAPDKQQQQLLLSSAPSSDAMFVFRFESEEEEEEEGHFGKEWCFAKNWSETSSSNSNNGGGEKRRSDGNSKKDKRKKRLGKTCSSSSSTTSSASSSASSTVMEWASHEEAELRGRRGDFSLLVYASKS